MQFKISQYEFKDSNSDDWQEVSEMIALGKLADVYDRLTPLLSEMLQGKEIITPEGIFRMKNCGNEGKDY
jgi:DNA mismatch repair protein MutH